MILYAETSSVLCWLFEEPGGEEVHRLLRDAAKVVCSRLTLIETRRVIRRAVTEKLLDEGRSTGILEPFARAAVRDVLDDYRFNPRRSLANVERHVGCTSSPSSAGAVSPLS